jgi:hypothetical protein
VFSAFYGCPLRFGENTSWSEPILFDWAPVQTLKFDWQHPFLLKLLEMTDALLEIGKDKFIVGMPDWHQGGDAIAAFRDPQNLALDMLEHPAAVKSLLSQLETDYYRLYDLFYAKLRGSGQPISTWLPLVCDDKFYIPSNDFSLMISKAMFDDIFLPGIVNDCRFLRRSIYHLDGPGALHHLDSILAIAELDALQYVPGSGNEEFNRWIPVYRHAQNAQKAIQVFCHFLEIDQVVDALDPHGVFLCVEGVPTEDAGRLVIKRLERWCTGKIHFVPGSGIPLTIP